jgi:ectoine hydroxylase-related dioxygenase (phytanoyl-CoA dioxygenase family)
MARLSDAEIAKYQCDGYVVPEFRLSKDKVDRMRATLDTLIADNPGVRPEKLVSAHVDGDNGEGVKGSVDFLRLAQDPDIIDLVEGVIGPDIILWGCHVFCKPGGTGFETPWHQDGHYWPIRPLATCTAWVALDRSDKANGCLRVIPGSHTDKKLHEHLHEDRTDLVLNQRMAAGSFDEADAVDLELDPGQMSLHDVYMIHGAAANTSPRRRAGVALRYMPATSLFDRNLKPHDGKTGVPVQFGTRPLWLVRGKDRTGKNDFAIGHRRAT